LFTDAINQNGSHDRTTASTNIKRHENGHPKQPRRQKWDQSRQGTTTYEQPPSKSHPPSLPDKATADTTTTHQKMRHLGVFSVFLICKPKNVPILAVALVFLDFDTMWRAIPSRHLSPLVY
jgi:hypothetical protein